MQRVPRQDATSSIFETFKVGGISAILVHPGHLVVRSSLESDSDASSSPAERTNKTGNAYNEDEEGEDEKAPAGGGGPVEGDDYDDGDVEVGEEKGGEDDNDDDE